MSWRALPGKATAIFIAVLFSVASYPGFMSFDSVEALRQAREGIEGAQYPPFGSYVWRMLDWIWPGPTLMQLAQNGLLMLSFAYLLRRLRWPIALQVGVLILIALAPPITGTMLVVWKDVSVAACFLASFCVLVHVHAWPDRRNASLIAAGGVLAFCGMAYRFNAVSGALPLLVYAIWLARGGAVTPGRWRGALLAGSVLTCLLLVPVQVLNGYRLPTFERLERNTNADSIMRFDLIGISRFSGTSVISGADGKPVDVEYLTRIYDPRHLNITGANDKENRLKSFAPGTTDWMNAILTHPAAYLKHRVAVFREYVGMHWHEVFYVTHPEIDKNPWGITHTPNALTSKVVSYVWESRNNLRERAWVYYAAALAAFSIMFVFRGCRYRVEAAVVFASGLLYLALMFVLAPAADVRYNFWSLCAAFASLAFSLTGLVLSFLSARGGANNRMLQHSTDTRERRPSAGVAMCVYNGERYLLEQLGSIGAQSELPQCLVVVDDGSTDGSWELLQAWAQGVPFEVKLHRNRVNLGVVRNFELAISMIEQDIVFLADQDDIWHADKVVTFLDVFQSRPQAYLVHSDANLIDGEGLSLGRKLFETLLVTPRERADVDAGKAYAAYARRNLVTGAACAIRRELFAMAAPFSSLWIHDEWLAFTAALTGGVVMLDRPTISYRLHSGNVVGIPITDFKWRIKTTFDAIRQPVVMSQQTRAHRLSEMHAHALRLSASADAVTLLDAAASHAKFRGNLSRNSLRRAAGIFNEAWHGRYHAWSSGEASIVHDLVFGD